MKVDLPTLLLVLTLTSAGLAGAVLAVAARSRVHHGLMTWGLGLVVNALSYPSFGLRVLGWPALSVLASNLTTALTLALHATAIAAFQRQRRTAVDRWVWALVALNVGCAALFIDEDRMRNIVVAGIQSALALVLLYRAWGPGMKDWRLTGRWVVVAGSLLLVATLAARTVSMLAGSSLDAHFKVPDHVQSLTYLAVLIVLQLNTIGFVLMQMERALERQHELATRDALTGVYNRHALLDALKGFVARSRRDGEPVAMLMIDLDHFKAVNDRWGHLAGDEVLREVARRIGRRLRASDFLARYGGEEFLVVLPNTVAAGAARLAEAIRGEVEGRPCELRKATVSVTVSIGVHASVPDPEDAGAESLIAASDRALYRAKQGGRNRVAIDEPGAAFAGPP